MAAPTTPLIDDFNRANENPLASGAVWAGTNLSNQANLCQLLSNQMAPIAGTGESRCTSFDFPVDLEFYVTVPVFTSQIDLAYRGINIGGGSWNGYLFESFGGSWQFYRIDAGGATTVGAGVALTVNNGDKFMVRATVNTHDLWVQAGGTGAWALIMTRTESTYRQAGRVELGFGSNTTGRFDDFGGGAYPAVPFRPNRMPMAT